MIADHVAKLLVVEDDDGVALLQAKYLERAGFCCVTAATAAAATKIVCAGGIDLIFLDYSLPDGMTGFDLHAHLLSQGHEIPVIMVTGRSDEFTSIQAIRSGVKDFVHKSSEYLDYLPIAANRVLTQHATERALAQSEARFRAVSDAAKDGIVALDGQGRIISWNSGAENIFGYVAEDAIGREFGDLLPVNSPPDQEEPRFGSVEIALAAQRRQSLELQGVRRDGTVFPMELSVGGWQSDGKSFYSGVIRDITARKRAEDALRQRDEQLRQSQKMEAVGTLAGGLAHEFNNLLQAIQAYTHFAMDGLTPEDQRLRDLEQVLRASERAADLTRQMLSFGRQQNLELADIDPNQLIRDLLKMTRPLIGEDITVRAILDEQPISIHADPGQFQQLLMNLCLNARDAMPSGGQLLVKSDRLVISPDRCKDYPDLDAGTYFHLTVRDTGSGIAEELKEHIFEPFFTTKEVGKGTGLGLAMVYGVVQQHGGAIRFDSTVGTGTAFHIYLPAVGAATPALETPPKQESKWAGGETLLIAEDESLVRETFIRILQGAGYRLLVARDGQEALQLFRAQSESIDLLLLDAVMPKMGGREFHAEAQQIRRGVPTVFCSGYDPETSGVGSVKGSGCTLLQKPFDAETLLRTVRTALDREPACHTC